MRWIHRVAPIQMSAARVLQQLYAHFGLLHVQYRFIDIASNLASKLTAPVSLHNCVL
jgi:hypothetical protein